MTAQESTQISAPGGPSSTPPLSSLSLHTPPGAVQTRVLPGWRQSLWAEINAARPSQARLVELRRALLDEVLVVAAALRAAKKAAKRLPCGED